jgi:Clostripain family
MQLTSTTRRPISEKLSRQLNFTAYLDGADPGMDIQQALSLDSFERVVSQEPSITGRAMWKRGYRAGRSFSLLPAAALATAGVVTALAGARTTGALLGGIGLALGVRPLSRRIILGSSQEPLWLGTKSFQLDRDTRPGRIDSALQSRSLKARVSKSELSGFFRKSFEQNPNAEQVVWVEGHGFGHKEVASFTTSDLAGALNLAQKEAGVKPELLILNSCLMSNLEALAHLGDSAHYIVASEDVMSVNALDGEDFLATAIARDLQGEELADEFMSLARAKNTQARKALSQGKFSNPLSNWPRFQSEVKELLSEHRTLAKLDMKKLPDLLDSLDKVGDRLLKQPELRKLAKKVKKSMKPVDSKSVYFDLGHFLNLLSESLPAEEMTFKKLLEQSELTRKSFVADFSSNQKNPSFTGVTVQLSSGVMDFLSDPLTTWNTPYRRTPLPGSWKEFVRKTF